MNVYSRRTLAAMALAPSLALSSVAAAASAGAAGPPKGSISTRPRACEPLDPSARVSLSFDGASVESFVAQVGKILCRNFVIDPRHAKQTLALSTPRELPVEALWNTFLVVLASQGLTIADRGAVIHVISGTDGTRSPLPLYVAGDRLPDEEQMISVRVDLPSADQANHITNFLNIFKTQRGQIHPWLSEPQPFLLITDYTSSVRRLLRLMPKTAAPAASIPAPPPRPRRVEAPLE